MTIVYKQGNIFTSECQTLVNPVNCVGVMGAGLAKQFKHKFPEMFTEYKTTCDNNIMAIGMCFFYSAPETHILCFPTKKHWKDPSHLDYIETGLKRFCELYKTLGITSIAFPPLGTGLGGLPKPAVKQLMEHYLSDLPIKIELWNI